MKRYVDDNTHTHTQSSRSLHPSSSQSLSLILSFKVLSNVSSTKLKRTDLEKNSLVLREEISAKALMNNSLIFFEKHVFMILEKDELFNPELLKSHTFQIFLFFFIHLPNNVRLTVNSSSSQSSFYFGMGVITT